MTRNESKLFSKARLFVFLDSTDQESPSHVITSGDSKPTFTPPFPPILDDIIEKNPQKDKKPTKSPNSFIIYRRAYVKAVRKEGYNLPMTVVSTMASQAWSHEPPYVKAEYKRIARIAKSQHELKFSKVMKKPYCKMKRSPQLNNKKRQSFCDQPDKPRYLNEDSEKLQDSSYSLSTSSPEQSLTVLGPNFPVDCDLFEFLQNLSNINSSILEKCQQQQYFLDDNFLNSEMLNFDQTYSYANEFIPETSNEWPLFDIKSSMELSKSTEISLSNNFTPLSKLDRENQEQQLQHELKNQKEKLLQESLCLKSISDETIENFYGIFF
ncbi:hypothetical protein G9A89_014709 [Geosiphon pyriformis]|nr:hypothetical protein G9A89_014709 [Geosiphon pyriformis]